MFTELGTDELRQIVDLMLKEVENSVKEKGMTITVTDKAKEFLLEKGYDVKFGARPLRRTIQKYIEDELAELYLKGVFKEGSNIIVDIVDGEVHFSSM